MPDTPPWIEELVQEVSTLMEAHDDIPVACHFHEAPDGWEISLFLMRVEVYGGGRDGERVTLPFHFDLSALPGVLDEVESLDWQTSRIDSSDELGAHVSLVGRCGEHRVCLRILAEAPAKMPTAGLMNSQTLELRLR